MSRTLSRCVLLNLLVQVNTCLFEVWGSFSNEGAGGEKNLTSGYGSARGLWRGSLRRRSSTRLYSMSLRVSLPHTVHVRWISDQEKADWYSQPCLAADSVIIGFWQVAKEKQKNKEPEGDCVWRSVIAASLIDRWSLSSLLSSWMQKSAASEREGRTAAEERLVGEAEGPAEVRVTLLLKKQQIESSEPETIACWPERVKKWKNTVWWIGWFIERIPAWAAGDGWSREWTDRYELETWRLKRTQLMNEWRNWRTDV